MQTETIFDKIQHRRCQFWITAVAVYYKEQAHDPSHENLELENSVEVNFLIDNLEMGGMQRSLVNIVNYLVSENITVRIGVYKSAKGDMSDLLHPNALVTYGLGAHECTRIIPIQFRSLELLRRTPFKNRDYLNQSGIVVNFDGYSSEISADIARVDAKRKIIWVHNDYSAKLEYSKGFKNIWRSINGQYDLYSDIVAVSYGALEGLKRLTPIHVAKRTHVIPNLIPAEEIIQKSEGYCSILESLNMNAGTCNFCYLGRFEDIKKVDELIEIFKSLRQYKSWKFFIIGDGPEKENLARQICEHRLGERVILVDRLINPYPLLRSMDVLLLNSAYEGQGMVLREAQALGVDVIFPKRLEKYNESLKGVKDMRHAIKSYLDAWSKPPSNIQSGVDELNEYNEAIEKQLISVLFK